MANMNISIILEKMTGKDKGYRYLATLDCLLNRTKRTSRLIKTSSRITRRGHADVLGGYLIFDDIPKAIASKNKAFQVSIDMFFL
uniref:Uncharacterized protein n=1 Tax=Leersia perrieri TaxID=77586 RepID=A0A0D9XB53_9ORYZ